MLLVIQWMLIFFIALVIASTLVFYLVNGIAPTPSSQKMIRSLQAHLPKTIHGNIVEAGAGWGGVTLWLATRYPKNTVLAWENAWCPFVVLWLRVRLSEKRNIRVKYGSFTNQSLSCTGLLYTFLSRKGMRLVKGWIEHESPSSLLLVSAAFSLPGIIPDQIKTTGSGPADELLFYYIH